MYRLCVIGDPVAHSRSPAIHTALLRQRPDRDGAAVPRQEHIKKSAAQKPGRHLFIR